MSIFKKKDIHSDALQLEEEDRAAGILKHISSLPSRFGIGDLGPEARKFAEFLNKSNQKLWQVLPLNPLISCPAPSPYSSLSSMAGNTLFISPELLVKDGLLEEEEIKKYDLPLTDRADYMEGERVREVLFEKAYRNFKAAGSGSLNTLFEKFCKEESYWLDDFALYLAIKNDQQDGPWYRWNDAYKSRDTVALKAFSDCNAEVLDKIKWLQFIFDKQWKDLRKYCHQLNVQLFGDVAFYVGYDSADVWSNPEVFSLDKEGNITGMAGVPPDYFSSEGQLWGMPVFRWEILKEQKYDWWIKRIKRNIELFDLVRLDHFRAFADYYEVPDGHYNAIHGTWKKGPGKDFFKAVSDEFEELPFIVEDLGDVTKDVYKLRDELGFPGMKILQFAFGNDISTSVHTPHNYRSNFIVYTGTHDNNTTVGWLKENCGKTEINNIKLYTGIRPTAKNIHLILGKLAYSSTARIVILPIQDILGLDEKSRMNTPGSMDNNWVWRVLPEQLGRKEKKLLLNWTKLYNR